ncbi:hypothetical protein EVAR_41758_1 [Eumeta japonica]|uniref:Uncharacterized protein n=1 Tax=Eumeta variegata TaxID=151549 RepID=A0A4C1W027_EUMVA|nr:hypothetical protein EVAR_41758_1 [Eumeta japonica]
MPRRKGEAFTRTASRHYARLFVRPALDERLSSAGVGAVARCAGQRTLFATTGSRGVPDINQSYSIILIKIEVETESGLKLELVAKPSKKPPEPTMGTESYPEVNSAWEPAAKTRSKLRAARGEPNTIKTYVIDIKTKTMSRLGTGLDQILKWTQYFLNYLNE